MLVRFVLGIWKNPPPQQTDNEKSSVKFRTDGRPLETTFEVWEGPGNTPQSVRMYSQDGSAYGVRLLAGKRQPQQQSQRDSGSYYGSNTASTLSIRNTGPMEFPITAAVGRTNYEYKSYDYGSGSRMDGPSSIMSGPSVKIIQGGSEKHWPVMYNVRSVKVELHSQGMPIMARVELLQGPNCVKACTQVYQQDGYVRPFCAVIDTPGDRGGMIQIVNEGPMEFPITASVEPYEMG